MAKRAKRAKRAARTKTAGPPKRRGRPPRAEKQDEDQGDHVRILAPEKAIKNAINAVLAAKNHTSEIGQELGTAIKLAQDTGVNIPAMRIAARFVSKAKADPLAARTLYEDTLYYLECYSFDRMAPPGMFTAEETYSRKEVEPVEEEKEQPEPPPFALAQEEEPATQH
jgi:hypothetical protein